MFMHSAASKVPTVTFHGIQQLSGGLGAVGDLHMSRTAALPQSQNPDSSCTWARYPRSLKLWMSMNFKKQCLPNSSLMCCLPNFKLVVRVHLLTTATPEISAAEVVFDKLRHQPPDTQRLSRWKQTVLTKDTAHGKALVIFLFAPTVAVRLQSCPLCASMRIGLV